MVKIRINNRLKSAIPVFLIANLLFIIDHWFQLKGKLSVVTMYFLFLILTRDFRGDIQFLHFTFALFSLLLLVFSYDQSNTWFGSLYLELGSSLIFVVLINYLFLRDKDETEEKLNEIQKNQTNIERMLKELKEKIK
jgi:hypothetical protein